MSCVVYDAAGNHVSRLAAGIQAAGQHKLAWDASGMRPGVYFCKLAVGRSVSTARLAIVR